MFERFTLLGRLQVIMDGESRPVPKGRQRALLATLLLSAAREVSSDELIDCVWGGSMPARPKASLNVYVMRLRNSLGDPEGRRLSTGQSGYTLQVDRSTVDVHLFHDLLAQAASHRDDAVEQGLLLQAIALWQGEPLVDIPSPALQRRICPVLEEQWLQAVDRLVSHDLKLGRYSEVSHHLRDLVGRFPFVETLWSRLILALYRGGRRAEALLTYREVHRHFLAELGLPPGSDLRELARRIESEDPSPTPVVTAAALSPPGGRLAAPLPLKFRSTEIDSLTAMLSGADHDGTVINLYGMPGVGKTTLARQVAAQVANRYPNGEIFVDLRGHAPGGVRPYEALAVLLKAVDVPVDEIPSGMEMRAALWRAEMAARQAVVILDDVPTARQAGWLLPGSGPSAVIVTSRRPLPLAADHSVQLKALPANDARAMFRAWSGTDPGLEPDDVLSACGGLPLAVAIAAERMRRGGSIAEVHEHLLTASPMYGGPSLSEVFSSSVRRLGRTARRAFLAVGALPETPFTAADLAKAAELAPTVIGPAIETLLDACLLDKPVAGRYQAPPLLHRYARETGG
ncbi:BTAD domain-containing putative transcriptional regulator [Nonomuraea sp. NPDC050404]|uniref:AfsR/SARP family transcriptional regulator n=1 Tax=Nonomuraea sp. NPDC050404 TaxID=3155783 RepID=UPI0033CB1D1C